MTPEEVAQLDAADRGEIDQRKVRISAESIERMNRAMIDNINAVVGERDILYHIGDAFWGHDIEFARNIRSQIRCKTIHHIWGNHDEPEVKDLFASSEKYAEVVVEHQKIFLCHYPMRAWDKSHKGSWCLYGHVHGSTWEEDKCGLSKGDRKALTGKFADILADFARDNGLQMASGVSFDTPEAEALAAKLLDALAAHNCTMLTLDVGVDTHNYRPWSMDEIRAELYPKIEAWRLRREQEKATIPAGSRK